MSTEITPDSSVLVRPVPSFPGPPCRKHSDPLADRANNSHGQADTPPAVSNGQGKTHFLCAGGGSAVVDLDRKYKHETWKKLLVSTPTKHSAILGSSLITEVEKTLF